MRFRRTMTVIVGVFFLVFGWRTVTLALHSLQNHPDSVSSRQEERFADVIPAYSTQKENDISDTAEEIILVNKDHPLEDTYQPDLVKLRDYGVEVDREIYDSLLSMLQDGEKEGLEFWVASGYRSMERQRELLEETGLVCPEMTQFHTFTDVRRDPRERVVSIAFYAFTDISEVAGRDDAAKARWFPLDEIPPLAFDHENILKTAIEKLF